MSAGERFVRAFHARRPGITSRAFARGGSYEELARRVTPGARVLDLACGDGPMLAHLPPGAIGVDLSREELEGVARVVQGRAQALPFATGAFDAVTCHLAFMLFEEPEAVVAELARVLAPGGTFLAILGGGPVAQPSPGDAFHAFLSALAPVAPPLGDRRARTEAGWQQLFAGWDVAPFERWELDLGGTFDDVWSFLASSYELDPSAAPALEGRMRAELRTPLACPVVLWLARASLRR